MDILVIGILIFIALFITWGKFMARNHNPEEADPKFIVSTTTITDEFYVRIPFPYSHHLDLPFGCPARCVYHSRSEYPYMTTYYYTVYTPKGDREQISADIEFATVSVEEFLAWKLELM